MKKISLDEMREIQMQMLDVIDKFCKENSIRYSLAGGTMLGAVRHKGYIPWDDDIDIQMLRADYEKFEKIFPSYTGPFEYKSLYRDTNWYANFAKLCDTRTVCIENQIDRGIGISIDIFPIDDVPDKYNEWNYVYNKLRFLHYIKTLRITKLRKGRSFIKNLVIFLSRIPLMIISERKMIRYYDIFCKSYNNKGYKNVFELTCGPGFSTPHKKDLYNELIEWPFEDRTYIGFKDADSYLSACYGDYMKLPPKEKRIFKHNFELFWKE